MYSFGGKVRYSEVDESGVLSIPAMLDYLQDCALFQSEELGVGVAHSAEVGHRWLLSAWEVEIADLPRFTDEVTVTTWASGFDALFAHRNFTMHDASGRELVRADSLWFMYEDATGRPMRPPTEEIEAYRADLDNDAPLDMPPIRRRIKADGTGPTVEPLVVTHAHLDTNHHVNNAQYVDMALGVLPEGLFGDRPAAATDTLGDATGVLPDARPSTPSGALPGAPLAPKITRLEVEYCHAARLGDVIYPSIHISDGACVVRLGSEGDGTPYANVRVR